MSSNELRQKLDKIFDTYFIKDSKNKVSFLVISDKLGVSEDKCYKYIESKGLPTINKDDMLYLVGYKYNDNLRTPQVQPTSSMDKLIETYKPKLTNSTNFPIKESIPPKEVDNAEIELLRQNRDILAIQLEEYRRKAKEDQQIMKNQKDEIRKHIRKNLELEEKHDNELREHMEKTNLGHALNNDIFKTLERLQKQLGELSSKDIKILLLVDSLEKDGNRHSRKVFVPKEQKYNFTIGHEFKHENPDMKVHYR